MHTYIHTHTLKHAYANTHIHIHTHLIVSKKKDEITQKETDDLL